MLSTINSELMAIYRAAVDSVKPSSLIRNAVRIDQQARLTVKRTQFEPGTSVPLANRELYIFGAGKAVLGMCEELLRQVDQFNQQLGPSPGLAAIRVVAGRVNVPIGIGPSSSECASLLRKYNVSYNQCALNNIPDQNSFQSTQLIVDLIREAKLASCSSDHTALSLPLMLGFVSGGGSALLALPKSNISIEHKRDLIRKLVQKGADIVELNTVRSCLSRVKRGKLASLVTSSDQSDLAPCQLVTFIISDIIDDPVDKIASGPTVLGEIGSSETVADQAMAILDKYRLDTSDSVREAIRDEVDAAASGNPHLVQNIVIGNNRIALDGAMAEAQRCQFNTINLGSNWCGEASTVVQQLMDRVTEHLAQQTSTNSIDQDRAQFRGICWLAGGETTITLGAGLSPNALGGRCQEMALLFAQHATGIKLDSLFGTRLEGRLSVMCAGTDGQDGPTPAAGVHQQLYPLDTSLVQANQTLCESLVLHDSHNFYLRHAPELLIQTGPSGTNVMDIYCLLYTF